MSPFTPPKDYTRIKTVTSFEQLVSTPFTDGVNALCWPRELPGNFAEVVALLSAEEGVTLLEDAHLRGLPVSPAGRMAVSTLLADQALLRELGADPILNLVRAYPRDEATCPVPTDVYSFHVDSSPIEVDTWLCTYHGASSQLLRNDRAVRRVDVPDTRARLLQLYGGEEGEDFQTFLRTHCYDLHYAASASATPLNLGVGNLWRLAVAHPNSVVPACIHRAPEGPLDLPARLLLIA
jgi:hypothetical protein